MSRPMNESPSQKGAVAFLSALIVLIIMFFFTGLLLYLVPGASSSWPWLLSPILVLGSDSGILIIAIIAFLMLISGALAVLKKVGLLEYVIGRIVGRYHNRSFLLLAVLSFLFMSLGAFIGIFEEVVPLVPLVIMLSRGMGWDDLTGLAITVLACGLGFAAAVANPFTIGIAQELAGLPMFSGAPLRIAVFVSVYLVFMIFIGHYVKKVGKGATASLPQVDHSTVNKKVLLFFVVMMGLMVAFIGLSPFFSTLRDLSLPLIALIFLVTGVGSGLLSGSTIGQVIKYYIKGALEMVPAIALILLAAGIKHLMVMGGLLDLLLVGLQEGIGTFTPWGALLITFAFVMLLNFFIGSGSAKAFILMPILVPTMDYLGLSRQIGILAFQFGDGFSNVLYPTNAVLLIALGLTGISYGKWLRFILPLQVVLILLSIIWLGIAYYIGY